MEPSVVGWIVGGIVLITALISILIAVIATDDEKKIFFGSLGMFLLIALPLYTANQGYQEGEIDFRGLPVNSIPIGKEYDVLAMNITQNSVYLVLKEVTGNTVILYERPLEQGIPQNLSQGDRIHRIERNQLIITIDN